MTAARAASLALFRELFPGEVLAPGQLATVSTVTLLVTALDPSQADALYQDLGDARAFGVIHEHFQRLGDAIRQGGGAVVKTMGEGVLASFSDVTAAVRTALELPRRLADERGDPPASPAGRRSPRADAGRHPQRSARLFRDDGPAGRRRSSQYARGGELVLTQAVAADPEVAALLNARRIEGEVVPTDLAGHPHVIRVRLGSTARLRSSSGLDEQLT